jgi:hypothetical protein
MIKKTYVSYYCLGDSRKDTIASLVLKSVYAGKCRSFVSLQNGAHSCAILIFGLFTDLYLIYPIVCSNHNFTKFEFYFI